MHWQLFLQCHESINNNTSHLKEKPIYHINMQTLKNTYVDISGKGRCAIKNTCLSFLTFCIN